MSAHIVGRGDFKLIRVNEAPEEANHRKHETKELIIETSLTRKALEIAKKTHAGQVDKGGADYINHPLYVASQMQTEDEVIVALLHDVVEGSNITFYDLAEQGFSYRIIDALMFLVHDNNTDYFDYIKNIAFNPIATAVKLGDLRHNSDLSRLPEATEADTDRLKKYQTAIIALIKSRNRSWWPTPVSGKTTYYKSQTSSIIKMEEGALLFVLDRSGKWRRNQRAFSMFVDDRKNLLEITEEDVKEALKLGYRN